MMDMGSLQSLTDSAAVMQDEFSTSRAQIRADIDVCMGGRAAEELVYGADQVGLCPGSWQAYMLGATLTSL